jgi:uncharacterized protein
MFKPSILRAVVGHTRFIKAHNTFSYKVFYTRVLVSKDKPKYPFLFSMDSWNILSLATKMHGNKDGSSWYSWVEKELASAGVPFGVDCSIYLVSHPRLFGYAFNPISYWLIHNKDGELYCVLTEVRNTFKQYHNYLLYHPDFRNIVPSDIFKAEKKLYVSPFNSVEGYYEFTFEHTEKSLKSVINYFTEQGHVLNTYMAGDFYPINNTQIIKTVFLYPAMTLLVVLRIHWQAVKLWIKKVKLTLSDRDKEYINGGTTQSNKVIE